MNFDKNIKKKKFIFFQFFLIASFFIFQGCSEKKLVYTPQPAPKLQIIDLNKLNLSKDKKIKLHVHIKSK